MMGLDRVILVDFWENIATNHGANCELEEDFIKESYREVVHFRFKRAFSSAFVFDLEAVVNGSEGPHEYDETKKR